MRKLDDIDPIQDKKIEYSPALICFNVGLLVGYCSLMALNPAFFNLKFFIPSSLTAGVGTIYLASQKFKNNLIDYFHAQKLQCNDQYPKILKHKKIKEKGKVIAEEYKISMPVGMCVSDFERHKEALEQHKRGKVNMWFDKNLNIRISYKIKTEYKFELEKCKKILEILVGYDVNEKKVYIDIEDAPHILIGGETGGGKSVLLRAIITSLILTKNPEMLSLNLVDFQRVELGIFKKCRMVKEFVTSPKDFSRLLDDLAEESDRRLRLFEKDDVVNIQSYSRKHPNNKLPYILTIVDEFGALAGEDKLIFIKLQKRIAQDRKCGLHYILCTQRPSTDVIKGSIKANIPARIALKVSTDTDSQVILDENGAEELRGKGNGIIKFKDKQEVQFMNLSEKEAYDMVKPTFIEKPKKKPKSERPGVIGNAYGQGQEDNTLY